MFVTRWISILKDFYYTYFIIHIRIYAIKLHFNVTILGEKSLDQRYEAIITARRPPLHKRCYPGFEREKETFCTNVPGRGACSL